MSAREVVDFLDRLKEKQVAIHPGFGSGKVTSFMGTCAAVGRRPSFFVRRLVEVRAAGDGVAVKLAGQLERAPAAGEIVAMSLVDVPGYRGYQVKTAAKPARYETVGERTRVDGVHVYTVHPSPRTASFFENIPHEDIAAAIQPVRHALVAVGPQANISPRFIYHWEAVDGGVALFHGDAFMNKTYYNVKKNPLETRVVIDLDDFTGYALRCQIEETDEDRDPLPVRRIVEAFGAAGYRPNRVYRAFATEWSRVAPQA